MGRLCQVIGYAVILLSLVPIAFTVATVGGGNGSATWMGALLFSLPFIGGLVSGVLMITFGAMLVELTELRRSSSYQSELLAKLLDRR